MIENNPTNVSAAFDMLLEEVEAEIEFVNDVGAKGFQVRDYEKAKEALERSGVLVAFRDRVATLRKEWDGLAAAAERTEDEETRAKRRDLGTLRRGQRTPEAAFYIPILTVLQQMNGRGETAEVIDRVGVLMQAVLKDVDHQPLASNPANLRWRNTAQWARNSMVNEGLLKADALRGVWEVSDQGKRHLERA